MTFTDNQPNQPATITQDGQGFLQGVQPAQPRLSGDWTGQQQTPAQQVSQPTQQQQPPKQEDDRPAYRWTDDDIAKVRQEEKDKLYGRIEDLSSQMQVFQEQQRAAEAERERLEQEAADARRLQEEGEMEVRDLLAKREKEWNDQLAERDARYEADRAVFERERQLADTELYRRDRMAQEAEFILPELREFITGNTPDEIDASIEAMKLRTESIFQNLAAAEPPQAPFQPRGAAPTAPPVGPMEQLPNYQSLTPDDIRTMDMETYKRYRDSLLAATSPANRRG